MRKARASDTRKAITDAVTAVLAEVGAGRLTHRRVAQQAGRSLSVTSYHFTSRQEMLDEAAQALLDGYLTGFQRLVAGMRSGATGPTDLAGLEAMLLRRAVGPNRVTALAWYEIMLAAARDPAQHAMAARWFDALTAAWDELAAIAGLQVAPARIRVTIDRVIGLQLIALALGLDAAQVAALWRDGDPGVVWGLADGAVPPPAPATTGGARPEILAAAIRLLVREGAAGLTYRALAAEAGLALSAPAYHFGSIAGVLAAAQAELFEAAKARYRSGTAGLGGQTAGLASLAESTTAIFAREAGDFGLFSVAHYSVWAEAARDASLRPALRMAVQDQIGGWRRRLAPLADVGPGAALQVQAHFIGRLIRTLATGGRAEDLASAGPEFLDAIGQVLGNQDNFSNFL